MDEIKQIIIDKAINLDDDGPFCIEFDYNEFAVIVKGSIYREYKNGQLGDEPEFF